MKQKKCKICNIIFTPNKYASCKTKCQDCIFVEHKVRLCIYAKKQALKPKKVQFGSAPKIDTKWIETAKQVKERDAGNPCISCGKIMQPHEIQAGHFIARAKSKELYYDLRNIHAQCWECNNNHQKQQETHKAFRNGLISRYSLEYVEVLEEIEKRAGRSCKNNT